MVNASEQATVTDSRQPEILERQMTFEYSKIARSRIYPRYVKPLIDKLAALLLIVVLLPVIVVICIWIKWDSPGPVLFSQERYGKHGRLFKIYKFRTMYTHAPVQGRSPVNETDPRVTRVGRFLRKTSLDEIPQLFNIMRGEMSFIGPRPEQKLIVLQHYTDYEKQRFAITPGITGLWQVSKDRTAPIHENLQHDFEYIEKQSFLMDLKIIYLTLKVMIRSNTY